MVRVSQSVMFTLLAPMCFGSIIPREKKEINYRSYPLALVRRIINELSPDKLELVNGKKTTFSYRSADGDRGSCAIYKELHPIFIATNPSTNDKYTVISNDIDKTGWLEYENCKNEGGTCKSSRELESKIHERSCCLQMSSLYNLPVIPEPNLIMIPDKHYNYSVPYYSDGITEYTSTKYEIMNNLEVSDIVCVCQSMPTRTKKNGRQSKSRKSGKINKIKANEQKHIF